MTGRSGTETRRRSEQVGVRLTPDEYVLLVKQAAERGLSPGEALRLAYFAGRARTDLPWWNWAGVNTYTHPPEAAQPGHCLLHPEHGIWYRWHDDTQLLGPCGLPHPIEPA